MRVRMTREIHGLYYQLRAVHRNGRPVKDQYGLPLRVITIQTDWDYPILAKHLGFVPCSKCEDTDGTVDCPHKTAEEMIAAARAFLYKHSGKTFEDPGYFSRDQDGHSEPPH